MSQLELALQCLSNGLSDNSVDHSRVESRRGMGRGVDNKFVALLFGCRCGLAKLPGTTFHVHITIGTFHLINGRIRWRIKSSEMIFI